MAYENLPLKLNPLMSWMWRLCGWTRYPAGMEADCEALIHDPRQRLSQGSIEFASLGWKMYLIWLPLVIVVEALIKVGVLDRATDQGREFIGWAGLIVVLVAYLAVPMIIGGRRLRLDLTGFTLTQGSKEMLIPWTSLHPGRDWSVGFFQITIPVKESAKEEILVTTDSTQRSIAEGATPFAVSFDQETEIKLTWLFKLDPRIFMFIAKSMVCEAAVNRLTSSEMTSIRESFARLSTEDRQPDLQLDRLPPGVKLFPSGVLQVPLTALAFPAACCRCNCQTEKVRSIDVPAWHYWWYPAHTSSNLQIPVCNSCWTSSWIKLLAILMITELFWTMLITFFMIRRLDPPLTEYLTTAVLATIPTRLTLFLIPTLWWRLADVCMNRTTKEFRFRFAMPEFRDATINAIWQREQSA